MKPWRKGAKKESKTKGKKEASTGSILMAIESTAPECSDHWYGDVASIRLMMVCCHVKKQKRRERKE